MQSVHGEHDFAFLLGALRRVLDLRSEVYARSLRVTQHVHEVGSIQLLVNIAVLRGLERRLERSLVHLVFELVIRRTAFGPSNAEILAPFLGRGLVANLRGAVHKRAVTEAFEDFEGRMFLLGHENKAVAGDVFLGAVRKLRKAGKFGKDLQIVDFQQTNGTHLRAVERGVPFTEGREHVLGRLDPVEDLLHLGFGDAALEAREVRFLLEGEAEEGLIVLDAREARDGEQQLRGGGGRYHEVEVRQHRHLALVLREHGGRRPFAAGVAQHHGRNLARLELELHETQEPEFAERTREVFPREMPVRFQDAVRRIHHPEHEGRIGHAAGIGDALEHLPAVRAVVAEAFLDPPCQNVLMQAESASLQELVGLFRRVEERVFLFEPALLREEVENQREFVLGGLGGNLRRRHEGRSANLVAAAVQRPVRVDAHFAALGKRKHETHVPVQKATVFHERLGRIHGFLRFDFETAGEIRKTAVDRSPRHLRTPQQVFAAHIEQERAEFLVLAYGYGKAQFVVRETARTAMVHEVHAAALPRFHLFKKGYSAGLVRKKGHHFGLN